MEGFDVVVIDSASPPKRRQRPLRAREHRARGRAASRCWGGSSPRRSWTGTARIRSCGRSTSPRWRSRRRCACARSPPGKTLVEARGRARSSTCSRSAIARPCSSASISSAATSRCGWPSRSCSRRACAGCTRRGSTSRACSCQAGQPILLPVEHGVTTATVTTPSGRSRAGAGHARARELHRDRRGRRVPRGHRPAARRGSPSTSMNAEESDADAQAGARASWRARAPTRRRCPSSASSGRSS